MSKPIFSAYGKIEESGMLLLCSFNLRSYTNIAIRTIKGALWLLDKFTVPIEEASWTWLTML
jgi:hypothetical protein